MKSLEGLNDRQKEAVEKTEGPVMIVAGAGAGKTKTITHRIMHLIEKGVAPNEILAVTFTNKAAKEMRERILAKVPSYIGTPVIRTFHSFGVHFLRENAGLAGRDQKFTICDEDDALALIKESLKELGLDPKVHEPKKLRAIISRQKGSFVSLDEYGVKADTTFERILENVWEKYEKKLKENNFFDFDDLIVKSVVVLRDNKEVRERYHERFRYVHIDEYQDTNDAQYELVKLLVGKEKNICVVGDTDQNIYSWRGAKIKNMLHFEKDFPGATIVFLEQNYRSTKTILDVANTIIAKNTVRVPKNLFTENDNGEPIRLFEALDERNEAFFVVNQADSLMASGVEGEEIAILYRTNFQSRVLEEACITRGVPYKLLGTRFYDRKEIKDVLSYIRVARNNLSFSDLKRALAFPSRGIGATTLAEILAGRRDNLKEKMKEKVDVFFRMLEKIKTFSENNTPSETIRFVIEESGIEKTLKEGGEDDLDRLENLYELVTLSLRYDSEGASGMEHLIDDIALMSDQDTMTEEVGSGIRLMTIHASKGLEFDHVMIVGLEHGLFPHERWNEPVEDKEEERRLFYVALTRARKNIILSYARTRTLYGMREMTMPSEFLYDIPPEYVVKDVEKTEVDTESVVFLD